MFINYVVAMALVGDVDAKGKELVQVTKECLDLATEAVRPGLPLTEIGLIIEEHASKHGLGIVQDYCCHGLGREIHQPPHILHYINNMKGELIEGMTFTIEPMLTEGSSQVACSAKLRISCVLSFLLFIAQLRFLQWKMDGQS